MHTSQTYRSWEIWEELANALTHGIGLLLSVIGLIWMISLAAVTEDAWKLASSVVFGVSLILLYLSSTLYHSFRKPTTKQVLRTLDHCAIYVLIAGSYTPFVLVTLQGAWGWSLFATVWTLAFIGIIFKICFTGRFRLLSTLFYVSMGWLVLVAIQPLSQALPEGGLYWVMLGGALYTFGAVIYALKRPLFHHAFWHLCVMGGSFCHYLAILHYVILV